jgi:hypothetical protein
MKAQDWSNPDPQRKMIIDRLSDLCTTLGLSFNYTEHKFSIELPDVSEQPVVAPHAKQKRLNLKAFDELSNWLASSSNAANESNLPDELPPIDKALDEGTPPETDDDIPEEDKPIKL